MFTTRQKLLTGGTLLFAVLLVAGSYFGRHWFYSPDVQPVPEHLLADKPRTAQMNRPVRASVSQDSPLLSVVESFSYVGSTTDSDEGESNDFPEVPDGFPLTPVWLEDYFHERDYSEHVPMYRVLIELWNRGHHGIINGVFASGSGRVYPIYPDVVYVTWGSHVREGPDGESIEVPFVSRRFGAASTVDPLLDSEGKLFTEQEIMSGDYKMKFAGISIVNYEQAGYDPATILNH